jgi:hypothetical protein
VIPTTLAGLVLFMASLGPGYVYVRVAERRVSRPDRSPLLEAAELLVIGALTTTVISMLVILGAREIGLIDVDAARREGLGYLLLHPLRGFTTLTAIFVLSYLVAGLAALAVNRGRLPTQQPGTVWGEVLGRNKSTHDAIATVELRDGRMLQGQLASYTLDTAADGRELALQAPMRQRAGKHSPVQDLPDDYLVLREEDVLYVAITYQAKPTSSAPGA